jgi:conjugative relaxase-like TrwC/TraI family protein
VLTISKSLTTGQAHSYHEQEFANSEQNYYSESQRVNGEWHGRLAAQWGLAGEVSGQKFYRLAEGQHPLTGEQLVQHRFATKYQDRQGKTVQAKEHRAGWDATFSAPKSVSITALVGADERVREAHRESVNIALDELERYVQARIGGNHPAETTGKMVAAKFEHDSARPVKGYSAPQLHTHVVIFNLTETPDGKSHALQPRELFKSQRYATAIYHNELATRLKRLGYEIERSKHGEFEIKGYTNEYLAASSPRRKQIKEYLEANKVSGLEAAEIGAHRTREKKAHLRPEEMQRINLALAAQYGNDPRAVVAAAQIRRQHAQEPTETHQALARAREAVTYARDRNIEREAVTEDRTLLRDALRRAMGEATLREIRENFERRVAKGEFVRVGDKSENALRRSFTTAQMLALEQENIATMQAGKGLGEPLVLPKTLRGLATELETLSESQRKAVQDVLESHDRITGLQGVAGSGKTTTLRAIRQAAERDGYKVEGFAPTSRAAHRLEEAEIGSTTLQGFLTKKQAAKPEEQRLFVLDESSLASTRQVIEFFKRLGPSDRVLLVGDIRQHQAVEAGRPFQQMQEAGMRTARLDQIIRQRDAELKQAVESLAKGEITEAVRRLTEQRRVHEIPDPEQRLKAVALEYLKHPEGSLVVSPDNQTRLEINFYVHESLRGLGKIGAKQHTLTILVNRYELTGADRQWAARYEPGDVIRYTRRSRRVGVREGEYATVVNVAKGDNLLTVRRQNGNELTYDPKRLHGVNVYQPEQRQFSKGDRVQFTAPFKEKRVANRELGHIENLESSGNIRVRLESGRSTEFNLREHPHLDYGYAMTSYTSQGQTVDRVIVHVPAKAQENSDLVHQRFAYVALSRARIDAQIYTNDASTLADRLGRDVSKTAAVEVEPFRQAGHFALKERHQQVQEQAQV